VTTTVPSPRFLPQSLTASTTPTLAHATCPSGSEVGHSRVNVSITSCRRVQLAVSKQLAARSWQQRPCLTVWKTPSPYVTQHGGGASALPIGRPSNFGLSVSRRQMAHPPTFAFQSLGATWRTLLLWPCGL
jgi:hypothetical protein